MTKFQCIKKSDFFLFSMVFLVLGRPTLAGPAEQFPIPDCIELEQFRGDTPQDYEVLKQIFIAQADQALLKFISLEAVALRARIRELTDSYVAAHGGVEPDECRANVGRVKAEANEAAQNYQLTQRRAFITTIDPTLNAALMRKDEVNRLFVRLYGQEQLITKANEKLSALIERSGPRSGYRPGDLQIQRVNTEEFVISTQDNRLLGYSVAELLHFSQENRRVSIGQKTIGAYTKYDGKTDFLLSIEDVRHLSEWLDHIDKWHNEFQELLAILVGPDVFRTGQKSVREFISGADFTTASQMREYDQEQIVLLFNTCLIDLTDHFDSRDAIKAIIESAYLEAGLFAKNDSPKTFIEGTYTSNVGVNQLNKITPRIYSIVKAKQLIEEIFGEGSFFGNQTDALEMLKSYKLAQINEIAQKLMGSKAGGEATRRMRGTLDKANSFSALDQAFQVLLNDLLLGFSGINFFFQDEIPRIDNERRNAIYTDPDGVIRPLMEYPGGLQHKNLRALFHALKGSNAVKPEFHAILNSCETQLINRMGREYAVVSAFARARSDEALEYVETLVERVVYHAYYQLTQESIDDALNEIAGLVGEAVIEHCSTGLAGRFGTVLAKLNRSTGQEMRDLLIKQAKMAYNHAFAETSMRNHESSMLARILNKRFADWVGIASLDDADMKEADGWPGEVQATLEGFAKQLDARKLYEAVVAHLSGRFWQLNKLEHDNDMYDFLIQYGFGTRNDLDKNFRINGDPLNRWQFSLFKQALPNLLISKMIDAAVLYPIPQELNNRAHYRSFREGAEIVVNIPAEMRHPSVEVAVPKPVHVAPRVPLDPTASVSSSSRYGTATYQAGYSSRSSSVDLAQGHSQSSAAAASPAPSAPEVQAPQQVSAPANPGIGYESESKLPEVREGTD